MHIPIPIQTQMVVVREAAYGVPDLLTTINNKYSAELSKVFRAQFGLGVSDCRIIVFLAHRRQATGAAIGEALQIDKALVSRCVARLKANGLVAQDGNGHGPLVLTRRGINLQKRITVVAQNYENVLLTGVDKMERQILARLLRKLEANLPLVASLTLSGDEPTMAQEPADAAGNEPEPAVG